MVGCFSGLTVSHTASLIAEKHKANSKDQLTVYVCVSDRTNAQREELQQAVTAMGCKSRHTTDVSMSVVWKQTNQLSIFCLCFHDSNAFVLVFMCILLE